MTDNRKQIDKFKEAAREAECDTDEEALDRAVKVIGKSAPKTQEEIKEGRKR